MTPAGLLYLDDFLTPADELDLIAHVDAAHDQWLHDLSRRVQHYGYRYHYKQRTVTADDYLGPLPPWLASVAASLAAAGLVDRIPDQAIVNEYLPGQGIAKHVDCPPCFGPRIATISLGSDCIMQLRHKEHLHEILLRTRSVLVLAGEARDRWTHEIPKRKSDRVDGVAVPRSRRLSLTFRTVRVASHCTP